MKNIIEIKEQVCDMQKQAYKIIDELNIVSAWEEIGAKVNIVGSLRMGLLVKHKDIDFHIYTNELNPIKAFSVIGKLAHSSKVKKVEYTNLSDEEDCCLEFHLWVEDDNNELWQIDMINIKSGSKYDGYFEKVADDITKNLTDEKRQIICNLKYQTPDDEKISGIEYYKAVIQDNIKTFEEFLEWRKQHQFSGIIEW